MGSIADKLAELKKKAAQGAKQLEQQAEQAPKAEAKQIAEQVRQLAPKSEYNSLLFVPDFDCTRYVKTLRKEFGMFSSFWTATEEVLTFTQLQLLAARRQCKYVAISNFTTFKRVADYMVEGTATDNYGYYFERQGLKIVFIPPLRNIWGSASVKFLIARYLSKLLAPANFLEKDAFSYTTVGLENLDQVFDYLNQAYLIGVDIETKREGQRIVSCAYTGLYTRKGIFCTKTFVVPVPDDRWEEQLHCVRRLNTTKPAKVMQNGGYDATYFVRWNAPLHKWLYDTFHLNHCLFPELPRDLAAISSFYLRNFRYWKEEAANDLYQYNGMDTHNTVWSFLGQLHYIRTHNAGYALKNFLIEFPIVFPCIHCGLEGIKTDLAKREELKLAAQQRKDQAQKSLAIMTGLPTINPNSPKQIGQLMQAVGYKFGSGGPATDEKTMRAFAESHPLYDRLHKAVTNYREASKAISTYYEFGLLNERFLYELNAGGTDSGRLAGKGSNLWVGTQPQNIPEYAKGQFKADDGWLLAEIDGSQSESRCTGYISQDLNLIDAVENSPDFHCKNASLFFGVPFEELFDVTTGKVTKVGKPIRSTGKRVNHGANYNMGWWMLYQTMGSKEVFQAARLLKLPVSWGPKLICTYLIECFEKAYPRVKGKWYREVIEEIRSTGMLVGVTGWTRRTFLEPWERKPDLNAAVAHPPQSLSVMIINKAFLAVWKAQLYKYPGLLRIKAQIHDSILFQYRADHGYIVGEVAKLMRIPVTVHGRELVIPVKPASGGIYWSDLKD